MWCSRKGKDCPDCGVFGECLKTAYCNLPNDSTLTVGSSSGSYSVNSTNDPTAYMPDELYTNGIKYVKEK